MLESNEQIELFPESVSEFKLETKTSVPKKATEKISLSETLILTKRELEQAQEELNQFIDAQNTYVGARDKQLYLENRVTELHRHLGEMESLKDAKDKRQN